MEEILPFELQVAEADDNSRYKVFMAYIDHEINGKRNGNAVVSLFERALVHYCLSTDLWGRYLNYMVCVQRLNDKFKLVLNQE